MFPLGFVFTSLDLVVLFPLIRYLQKKTLYNAALYDILMLLD